MAVQSPFLRLDELKRKRDEDTYNTMVESARQFGQAPLVLDKVIKENEDRASKAKQQQYDNDMSEAKLNETGLHNQAMEAVNKQNADTSGVKAGVAVDAGKLKKDTVESKANDKVLEDAVLGRVSQNPNAPDEEVIAAMQAQPGLERYNPDQVAAAVARSRLKLSGEATKKAGEDQKIVESQARVEAIKKKAASRLGAKLAPGVKPRLIGEKTLQDLGSKKIMHKKINQLISSIDNLSDSDLGLLEDLKEKYGSYAGLQDNQVRMQYKGLFNKILRDRSGMTVTDNELARLEEEIPSWKAGKDVIVQALGNMSDDLETEILTTEDVQEHQGGRTIPEKSSFGSSKAPPPKDPSEKRSDYAKRLFAAGFSEDQIMKIVMGQ